MDLYDLVFAALAVLWFLTGTLAGLLLAISAFGGKSRWH